MIGDFIYNVYLEKDYKILKENIHIVYGLAKMKYPNTLTITCEEANETIVYYYIP